jgi:hypothetical protein
MQHQLFVQKNKRTNFLISVELLNPIGSVRGNMVKFATGLPILK